MIDLGWTLLIVGLCNALATRLGWYDRGGLMRRMDWLGIYDAMERSWIGGGVRRANYTIATVLALLGLLSLLRAP